ncbi:Ribonuclease M5 [Alteracholeplasma palmae J233]|uniref:Ribonuclease M5 n=1 Tax=Alteracholeplasma palmae (strain ATCC 49389 / J233) TaxID=1318466 RepID=U4KQX0_ALTPJ|nr:ribonuclease M5 [Alteracholeplasma palmae]CCV63671.1 Ribonuclease M5 [Alteracholeplasma palmae J233]
MNQIIVVEGYHDQIKINQIYKDAQVMITNGSALSKETLLRLKALSKDNQMILFLDPDHAGERLRRILSKELANVVHAFLDQELAHSKNGRKIGIEHASTNDIQNALNQILIPKEGKSDITLSFLYENNLLGKENSRELRLKLAKKFNLGVVNGKTLHKRLIWANLTQKDLLEELK